MRFNHQLRRRRDDLIVPIVAVGVSKLIDATERDVRQRAKKMSDQAAELFANKRYLGAAELFEQSYALDNRMHIRIRNAGRAYEEAGELERALHCFQRFARLTREAELAADARQRIARIEIHLKASGESVAAATTPGAGTQPADAATDIEPVNRNQTMFWLSAATGGALTIVGIAWTLRTENAADALDRDLASGMYAYPTGATKLEKDRKTVASNRWGCYPTVALGVAAIATSVWLSMAPDDDVAVLPMASSGPGITWVIRL